MSSRMNTRPKLLSDLLSGRSAFLSVALRFRSFAYYTRSINTQLNSSNAGASSLTSLLPKAKAAVAVLTKVPK